MRTKKKNRGLVFGVFDELHEGHRYFLSEARKRVDSLVVVVAHDDAVRELKKRPPRHLAAARLSAILSEKLADKAVIGDSRQGSWRVLHKHKPDVVILGYDQEGLRAALLAARPGFPFSFDLVIIEPYHPNEFHTRHLNNNSKYHPD